MDITGIRESHGVATIFAVKGSQRRPSNKQDFQEGTVALGTDTVNISVAGKKLAAEYQAQKAQSSEAGQVAQAEHADTQAAANSRYARRASLLPENATKLLALEKRLSEEIALGENTFSTTLKISYIEQVGDKKMLTDAELEGIALKADAVTAEKSANATVVNAQSQQQSSQQVADSASGHNSIAVRQFQSRLKQIVTMPAMPSSVAA